MQKIYVGTALTNAPEEFRGEFQQEMKEGIQNLPDVEVIDGMGLSDGNERGVYTYSRYCAEECDLLVVVCDHPSIGLGMEIAFRYSIGKPMLLFAREDVHVTRMLLGFAEVEGYEFIRYESVDDIVAAIKERLGEQRYASALRW